MVMTTAAGLYKFFKMHKTEQADSRDYDIGTKAFDKSLSSDVHEIRGNLANYGEIYSRNMFNFLNRLYDITSFGTVYA